MLLGTNLWPHIIVHAASGFLPSRQLFTDTFHLQEELPPLLAMSVAAIPQIKQLKRTKQLHQALTPAPATPIALCQRCSSPHPHSSRTASVCGVGIFKGVISDPPFSHKSFHVGRMNYLNCDLAGIQNCLQPLLLIFIEIICITESLSYPFWSTRIATSETSLRCLAMSLVLTFFNSHQSPTPERPALRHLPLHEIRVSSTLKA